MNRKTLTVVLSAKLNGTPTNVLLDSGAGVSIMNEHSLKQIMKFVAIDNANEQLLDASGNKMIVLGKVTIDVSLKGSKQPVVQDFRVVNTNECINILPGRDFSQKFGSVTFNFDTHLVKLGKHWFNGVEPVAPQQVTLVDRVCIPPQNEKAIIVKSHHRTAFLVRDFEPTPNLGPEGTYGTYARVIPNAEGVFRITVINFNSKDIELPAGKIVRFLHTAGPAISVVSGRETDSCASWQILPHQQIQIGMKLTLVNKNNSLLESLAARIFLLPILNILSKTLFLCTK